MPRMFTPAEANQTLPLVRRIVADILSKGRELQRLAPGEREGDVGDRVRAIERELAALMRELEEIGCSYKDFHFQLGLVDFPSRIEGEDVLLCWRSDEEVVGHYHGFDDGYPGRRPIPAELLEPQV